MTSNSGKNPVLARLLPPLKGRWAWPCAAVLLTLAALLVWAGVHKFVLASQPDDKPAQTGIYAAELINVVHESLRGYLLGIKPAPFLLAIGMIESLLGLLILLSLPFKRLCLMATAVWIFAATLSSVLANPSLAGQGCGCFGAGLLEFDSLLGVVLRNTVIVMLLLALYVAWTPVATAAKDKADSAP
jgi:hypothetical protein